MPPRNLPSDDAGATLTRVEGARGQRYGEIILLGADAATGRRIGSVYNTTGLNDPTESAAALSAIHVRPA